MCVLNGRFDQDKDNFTFISGRGKSVADYICVPQDYIDQCISFETITTRSIVEKANLFNFLGERSKLPDHVFTLNSIIKNNPNVIASFIDLKKAFDFVDRDMLLYKLLLYNIDGKIYNSIKSLYVQTTASIRLNNKMSDWFLCNSGVKQDDNLSPTLFSVFIGDLVDEINKLGLGINIGESKLSLLLYADDIILMAENECDMQKMLDKLHDWCKKKKESLN